MSKEFSAPPKPFPPLAPHVAVAGALVGNPHNLVSSSASPGVRLGVSPRSGSNETTLSTPPAPTTWPSLSGAALWWLKYGFNVTPTLPRSKVPACKWDPWLKDLTPEKIAAYWSRHPDHEVGFIVGDEIIVFDADSDQAKAALNAIEKKFNVRPNLVATTTKGEHHFFRRAEGVHAKSDSHSTEKYPERIDIKTGRALVMLAPSTGKAIKENDATSADHITIATQEFIDAVFTHNGRTAPCQHEIQPPRLEKVSLHDPALPRVAALLDRLDPDEGYQYWLQGLMVIDHESQGSEDGLDLADAWSSRGSKYRGRSEIESKWRSFKSDADNVYTIRTLAKRLPNWIEICDLLEPQFERCEYEIVQPQESVSDNPIGECNPLAKYSLRGQSLEIEKQTVSATLILGQIAIRGQFTIIFAAPNTGKTLIVLHLIIEAIQAGKLDPQKVFYLDMDDNSSGLLEKLHLAEEHGFQILADGFNGFSVKCFISDINSIIKTGQAQDIVLILDTLKKFSNVMDKTKSATFNTMIRQFVLKGATVIALAHTNKKPSPDGKNVYGGTSDTVDDADNAYLVHTISQSADMDEKVVEFVNIKNRGNVAMTSAFSYSIDRDISYVERLISVQSIAAAQIAPLKQMEAFKSDAEIIAVVESGINEGLNTKMLLVKTTADRAGISKRSALKLIEKYTGSDPTRHRWNYEVHERGAKIFLLLEHVPPVPFQSGSQ